MAKKKRLTPKQAKFVAAALEPGVSQKDAVKKAGYLVKSDRNARVMAAKLMNNTAVQKRMDELISEEYPEAGNEAISVLRAILRDDTLPPKTRMEAIDRLARYKGWAAPTKSLNIKANVDKYKLPGGEE